MNCVIYNPGNGYNAVASKSWKRSFERGNQTAPIYPESKTGRELDLRRYVEVRNSQIALFIWFNFR